MGGSRRKLVGWREKVVHADVWSPDHQALPIAGLVWSPMHCTLCEAGESPTDEGEGRAERGLAKWGVLDREQLAVPTD